MDVQTSWSKEQVGRLWWDLSTVKFYNAYQNNIIFANNYWNKIFPGSSIDVCEWVESTYTPQEWNALASSNSAASVLAGISGTARYNTATYAERRVYDYISKSFSVRYYFWVKDKKTLPNIEGRKITAFDVNNFIDT